MKGITGMSLAMVLVLAAYVVSGDASPLHDAVASKNLTAVKALLESGKVNVNAKNNQGLTALQVGMTCAEMTGWRCWPRADTAMVEYLVSKGANVKLDIYPGDNPFDKVPGYTLLHKAAFHGLTGIVKALLKGGADPNAVAYRNKEQPITPLMAAAKCDNLLSTGDPTPSTSPDITKDSTYSTMKALLDAGANPLPLGKPLTTFFRTPSEAAKCNKFGACTEAEVKALISKYFTSDGCPDSWLLAWRAQNKAAAAAAAKTSGRRMV